MRLKTWTTAAVAAGLLLTGLAVPGQAQAHPARGFVTRSGTHLTLDGRPFRFSGPNIEWLGLATAKELGATGGPGADAG